MQSSLLPPQIAVPWFCASGLPLMFRVWLRMSMYFMDGELGKETQAVPILLP